MNSALISAIIFIIGTIANAAVIYYMVNRHETAIRDLDGKVDKLITDVAVLRSHRKGGE